MIYIVIAIITSSLKRLQQDYIGLHSHALQVQLRGNAQEEMHVERYTNSPSQSLSVFII